MPAVADVKRAAALLASARCVCVLTGAGVSAESGLKTFRDNGGLWEDHAIEDVATPEGFIRDPELVWRFYNARRRNAHTAEPNPAHRALARLEARLSDATNRPVGVPVGLTVLTQNIDGLHQAAGSKSVIELHGSLWKVRCTDCGILSTDFPVELPVPPACAVCDGLLRPHVVWFGEPLDDDILSASESAVVACDLFLVVGTSALVQPAASYPFMAARRNVPVIEVNLEPTLVSTVAEVSLIGKAGELLPRLVAE